MSPADRIIVAVDRPDAHGFWSVVEPLAERTDARWLKIGSVLFCAEGPQLVREVVSRGFNVFLDLKLHDIPHQVGLTVGCLRDLGVKLLTVHTSGGPNMLEAAVSAADGQVGLLGVTVLTSHDPGNLEATAVTSSIVEVVTKRARLASELGLSGIVCSPHEVSEVKRLLRPGLEIVTPGIRPSRHEADDQKRTATPNEALSAGATRLVIGRPITAAADPCAAYDGIAAAIGSLS